MPQTIEDLPIGSSEWVNLNTTSGIEVGTKVKITNKGIPWIRIYEGEEAPSLDYKSGELITNKYNYPSSVEIYDGSLPVWALCSVEGKVGSVNIKDSSGDTLLPSETDSRGTTGVSVFIQDQKSKPLSLYFLQERTNATLASTTVTGDYTFTLVTGHGSVAGDVIQMLHADTNTFIQAVVLSVDVDTITIDQPLNYTYDSSDIITLASKSINVDGSTTPQVFSISPDTTQVGDMVRVLFNIQDNTDMDFGTFGGITALTRGCVLRVLLEDGTYQNIANFKTNGDLITECFEHEFLDTNGQGMRGFSSRLTWGGQDNHGVVIPLDGSRGEELQLVVQDDLTGLSSFNMKVQGHATQ